LCQDFLKNKASETAQNAILNPKSKNKDTITQKQDRHPDGDDSVDVGDVDPVSVVARSLKSAVPTFGSSSL